MPDSPASPCTYDCVIDNASGRCRGCHRSLQEITAWFSLTPAQKLAILRRIEESKRAATSTGENKKNEPLP
ncbi:MAG: DUF1289 domain-containing protein [Verrucomicrobiota bacterium]